MPKKEATFHVGIDLGTTNTVMATCKPSKRSFFRPNVRNINQYQFAKQMGSSRNLPSVLFLDNDGEVKVGEYAKHKKEDGVEEDLESYSDNSTLDVSPNKIREAVYETILSIDSIMAASSDNDSPFDFIKDTSATPDEKAEI